MDEREIVSDEERIKLLYIILHNIGTAVKLMFYEWLGIFKRSIRKNRILFISYCGVMLLYFQQSRSITKYRFKKHQ